MRRLDDDPWDEPLKSKRKTGRESDLEKLYEGLSINDSRVHPQMYRVELRTERYKEMYDEAQRNGLILDFIMSTSADDLFAGIVLKVGRVNLKKSSSADVYTLKAYFANRGERVEQIRRNVKVSRIK